MPPGKTAYVLIAESDPARGALFRRVVVDQGIEPVVSRDGVAARGVLRLRGAPVLLITNLSLTGIDGFALLHELRRVATFDQCPALVVSAVLEMRSAAWNMRDRLGIAALLATSAPPGSIRRAIESSLVGTRAREPEQPRVLSAEAAGEREWGRLRHIAELRLGDQLGTDQQLQRIVEETARIFEVPIALLSVVVEGRQALKAHVGLPLGVAGSGSNPHSWAFTRHVAESGEPTVVPDAAVHPLFASNPLVRSGALRSYAGAPLKSPQGHVLGTLCIADIKPLGIKPEDLEALVILARHVAGELELRAEIRSSVPAVRSLSADLLPAARGPYLDAVLMNLDAGILLTDHRRRVVLASPALLALAGSFGEGAAGMPRDDFMRQHMLFFDDRDAFLERVGMRSEGPSSAREEIEVQRPHRRWLRWIARPVQLPEGVGQLEIFSDITAEVDLADERERLARTDALTGLANRRAGEETLAREIARARRDLSPLSLLICEIDGIRDLNERLGVGAGDRAIGALARLLTASVRAADLAVRWAGAVFLAVLASTPEEGARVVAERLRTAFGWIPLEGIGPLTLSLGVASWASPETQPELVTRVELHLNEARKAGGNRVQ